MKKLAIGVLGILMLMSVSSFATETRTMVMGDNDLIMVDDFNVFRFPGRVNNYPNIATGEFNTADDFHNFGINWQFGDDDSPWVLGTYFSTMAPLEPELVDLDMFDLAVLVPGVEPNTRRIDLLYGRELFGNNFGFRFNYNQGSYKAEAVEEESFGYYLFGFGWTEATSGQWDLAFSVGLGTWTDKNGLGEKLTAPDGYSDIVLEGRHFRNRSPKITLVEHCSIGISKRGITDYNDPADAGDDMTFSESTFAIMPGVGMNYTPGPNLLAAFDFGLQYLKIKDEVDGAETGSVDDLILPYFKIGFEAEVFNWMDVRMGATSVWERAKVDIAGTEFKASAAANDTYLGFGFHWGRLYVDTYTDPELFLNGFQFITGAGIDGRTKMNFQISALYELF